VTGSTRTAAPHARYRERIAEVLAAATRGPILGPPGSGWTIHMTRFQPDRVPWARVVQRGPGRAELVTTDFYDDDRVAISDGAVDTSAGTAVVRQFPDDAALPSLRHILASVDEPTVVRYRPGSRCTMRANTTDGLRWLKVYGGGIEAQWADASAARWRASTRGELGFLVAEPDHVDVRLAAEWQRAVPGQPIARELRQTGAIQLTRQLGTALATLSRSSLVPSRTTTRGDELARTERAIRRVARTVPNLAEALGARAQRLADAVTSLPAAHALPIHGSPHEHQWLHDGDGHLGLVDFDRWALGEPELDAATFLGELHFEHDLADGLPELSAAVSEGYTEGAVPLDHRVVHWYLAHKLLAKVVRTAFALRVDGDERASRHLNTVDDYVRRW
jgi:aminoglycoside phosphotransferase (APT) family kinase protein